MNRRHLPAVEALENLFDSDSSPVQVENPEELALTIVQWLIDSGFEIALPIGGGPRSSVNCRPICLGG